MTEWSVLFEFDNIRPGDDVEERIERLLEALAPHSPAVNHAGTSAGVRLSVEAEDPNTATTRALALVMDAMAEVGLTRLGPTRMEAERGDDLDRRVQESNAPEVIGVSELAELLGVTRQRASELARSADFPRPIAELASGPIWRKASVARYVGRWPRRPGRPSLVNQLAAVLGPFFTVRLDERDIITMSHSGALRVVRLSRTQAGELLDRLRQEGWGEAFAGTHRPFEIARDMGIRVDPMSAAAG